MPRYEWFTQNELSSITEECQFENNLARAEQVKFTCINPHMRLQLANNESDLMQTRLCEFPSVTVDCQLRNNLAHSEQVKVSSRMNFQMRLEIVSNENDLVHSRQPKISITLVCTWVVVC